MARAEQMAKRVVHWLFATRDSRRLYTRFPMLKGMRNELDSVARELDEPLSDYCFGHPYMKNQAISLELAATLLVLCRRLRPTSILDLGSGFSSLLFRSYAHSARPQPEVWSVDDSADWLERTRGILIAKGLNADHMLTWRDFNPGRRFDMVLHDLGNTEVRMATVDRVCTLVTSDGMIVLDDAHHYRTVLLRAARGAGLATFSLRRFTLDAINRYAFLAAKPPELAWLPQDRLTTATPDASQVRQSTAPSSPTGSM